MTISDLPDTRSFLAALDSDDYIPLRLGSVTAGWAKPHLIGAGRTLNIVLGNRVLSVNRDSLWFAANRFDIAVNRFDGGEYAYTQSAYSTGEMVLNLPDNSLDVENNVVKFTERSTKALYAALSNCSRLNANRIMSSLNQQTPKQVVETIHWLYTNGYPLGALSTISWRGVALNQMLSSTRMMCLTQVDNDVNNEYLSVARVGDATSNFIDFLLLQTAHSSWLIPENIFLLEVDSVDELTLDKILVSKSYLDMFLKETEHEFNPEQDRVFFFTTAEDCLSEWVMGKRIPIAKLQEMANRRELL